MAVATCTVATIRVAICYISMAPMAPGVASTLMGPLLYNPPLEEREREFYSPKQIYYLLLLLLLLLIHLCPKELRMKSI